MGYKGRHRAPTPFAHRIRVPLVLMAMVTPGIALTMGDPVDAPPDQPTVPMPPVTSALPTTPPATTEVAPTTPAPPPTTEAPPPQTTSTPKPKPSKTTAPPASSKGDLVFPTSGPRYGGVKPHVRKVGWLIAEMFNVSKVGGVRSNAIDRSGHPAGLALDFMVPVRSAKGDRIAQFLLDHKKELGIKYVIWKQRINHGSGWKRMEDRGGVTANHMDHVHASFY